MEPTPPKPSMAQRDENAHRDQMGVALGFPSRAVDEGAESRILLVYEISAAPVSRCIVMEDGMRLHKVVLHIVQA